MYYMSIDVQENELSDGVKIANNSCEKIISSGKRWELSHQPINTVALFTDNSNPISNSLTTLCLIHPETCFSKVNQAGAGICPSTSATGDFQKSSSKKLWHLSRLAGWRAFNFLFESTKCLGSNFSCSPVFLLRMRNFIPLRDLNVKLNCSERRKCRWPVRYQSRLVSVICPEF